MDSISQKILDEYFEDGVSAEILSAKYGRSQLQIQRITKAAKDKGRVRKTAAKGRRSVLTADPLSRVHRRVGSRFIYWRDIEKRWSVKQAAEHLGISYNRYVSIEGGIHNWTLLELLILTDRLGWSLADLLKGADVGNLIGADVGGKLAASKNDHQQS